MKKPFVLIAAIVAVVGLGAAVAVAKVRTEVGASMTLNYQLPQPDHPARFVGRVKASRGCQNGRTVTVTNIGPGVPGSRKVGSDKSGNNGKYKIVWRAQFSGERNYRAVVEERKTTTDNGDKIVCKRAASKVYSVVR